MFLVGVIINAVAIFGGSLLGLALPAIPERTKSTIMQGLSLTIILIGLSMALADKSTQDMLIVILSMVLGGLLGEWLGIEQRLEHFAKRVEQRLGRKGERGITEGFVMASLVFCVGSMAIVGSIQSGLEGSNKILYDKSMLDGFTSLIFTSTFGFGVALSALPVLIYEGLIATLAYVSGTVLNSPAVIQCMSATGGLLIVAIGINIMGTRKIAVGNLLPAMFIAAGLKWAAPMIGALSAGMHV